MGDRSSYTPGTFSWAELTTTDQEAAKSFYASLLGWQTEDIPLGEGIVYSMQRVGGRNVAAISAQPQQQRDAGVPSMWNSYVTVASADDAAARAGELGANVHAPPFDVMEAGRMAVIQDPQGAFFQVWEAGGSIGAELVNVPGAMCWNELSTPDMDAAKQFYGDLFGWSFDAWEGGEEPYFTIKNGDRGNGGMRTLTPGPPPNWGVYFAVQQLDGAIEQAGALGGSLIAGPIDIGVARVAVVQDPQGAMLTLYDGELEE